MISLETRTNVAPRVVRYESHHEAAVLAFLREAFPDTPLKADREFHHWRFLEGPHGDSTRHCFLAMVENKVVGQLAAIRDRLWWHGEWRDCIWMLDLMILPQYRGGHTAVRLVQSVMASADLALAVGAGPHVVGFYRTLGWKLTHVADTIFAPLRPSRLLQLASAANGEESGLLRKRLLELVNPSATLLLAANAHWASRGEAAASVVSALPEDAVDLEKSLRPGLGVTTDRSLATLHWKFTNRPFGSHFFVTLRSRSKGTLCGVAAVKMMQRGEARWAEVVDYLADPTTGAPFRRLMALVVRDAYHRDLDFVRVRVSLEEHIDALEKPFWFIKNRPVIDDLLLYSKDKTLVEQLIANSTWHLTTLVSDRTDHGGDEVTSVESPRPTSSQHRSPQP